MISETEGSSRKVLTGVRNFRSVTSKMASLFTCDLLRARSQQRLLKALERVESSLCIAPREVRGSVGVRTSGAYLSRARSEAQRDYKRSSRCFQIRSKHRTLCFLEC